MTIDWNRFTWKRKMKHWKKPLHLVTPSKWLHDCVRESPLMEKWPVSVIPNCLDTAFWQPICKTSARNLLGVSSDTTLIGFGSFGGNSAFHKGADLLNGALKSINTKIPNLELVIFGRPQKLLYDNFGWELPTHYVGAL